MSTSIINGAVLHVPHSDGDHAVKVYVDNFGEKRLIGRANVPEDQLLVFEVRLFGASSVIVERFTLGVVTHLRPGCLDPVMERAVLLAPGQPPELLPGWQPLAS